MANRIPLIVDTGDGNKIKELPIGDNLDLTGSGISGASSIQANSMATTTGSIGTLTSNDITVNTSADLGNVSGLTIEGGTVGQVLTTDGTGVLSWSTLGNYNQSLNTTDDVQFNFINARRLEAPINVTAEIRTSSTGSGVKTWQFSSVGNLTLPAGGDIRNSDGNSIIGYTSIQSNILPDANNTRDIGSNAVRWRYIYGDLTGDVYADDDETLMLDAANQTFYGELVGSLTGTADVASTVTLTATNTTNATHFPIFVDSATGNEGVRTDTSYTYNPSTGVLNSTGVSVTDATVSGTAYSFNISSTGTANLTTVNVGNTLSVTAGIQGDLTGSVYSDNSTQMINGVTGKVVGPIEVNIANISITGGTPNQVIKTNGSGVLSFVDQSAGGGGGGAVVLDDLTDVTITSAANGQILKYNGAAWVNSVVPINTFGIIATTGSAVTITPAALDDTFTFTASTGISITPTALTKTLTITNTAPNVTQNVFTTIAVAGQNSVVADTSTDTLTLTASTGISITTNDSTDTITITNSAPNVTQNVFTTIAVAGQSSVVADTSTDTLTLVAGNNVTITTNDSTDSITINATHPNTFTNIAVAGQNSLLADNVNDTLTLVGAGGITITTNDSTDTVTITGGGGGSGLESRSTAAGTTASLSDLSSADLNITGFKGYALLKIQTSVAAWVRVYTDSASRSSDSSRLEVDDPAAGSGVIAEVITTGGQTILISPGVIGFNNETSPTTTIPVRVTNKSGSTAAVTVTLTLIKLEA